MITNARKIKWTAEAIHWAAIGFAAWWCGLATLEPRWKEYAAFAIVGIACRLSGRMHGYLVGLKEAA